MIHDIITLSGSFCWYEDLVDKAEENPDSSYAKVLNCLNETLDHFDIEGRERSVVGETILRMTMLEENVSSEESKSILLKLIFSYFEKLVEKIPRNQ